LAEGFVADGLVLCGLVEVGLAVGLSGLFDVSVDLASAGSASDGLASEDFSEFGLFAVAGLVVGLPSAGFASDRLFAGDDFVGSASRAARLEAEKNARAAKQGMSEMCLIRQGMGVSGGRLVAHGKP
jgi:hypothetical protein